jgi:hypothetical protein
MSITTFNRIIVFNDLIYKELVGYKRQLSKKCTRKDNWRAAILQNLPKLLINMLK